MNTSVRTCMEKYGVWGYYDGSALLRDGARSRSTAVNLARQTADTVPNASVVFLIVGSSVTSAQLRSAAAAIPTGIRSFAIRCHTGEPVSRARIGDLTVLTIGDLSELSLVLLRAAA